MLVNTEIADKYQEFFNFMSREHNLILTIQEMDEIRYEIQKLESNLKSEQLDNCTFCGKCKCGH